MLVEIKFYTLSVRLTNFLRPRLRLQPITYIVQVIRDRALKSLFNTNPKPAVVYVYCDSKERKKQTVDNLMLTLLKQAILQLEESESMPREVFNAHDEHAHGETHMSRTEVRHLLIALLKRFRRSLLVIDALDEYVHSRGDAFSLRYVEIFDEISEVISGCNGSCRIFVTYCV